LFFTLFSWIKHEALHLIFLLRWHFCLYSMVYSSFYRSVHLTTVLVHKQYDWTVVQSNNIILIFIVNAMHRILRKLSIQTRTEYKVIQKNLTKYYFMTSSVVKLILIFLLYIELILIYTGIELMFSMLSLVWVWIHVITHHLINE